MIKLSIVGLETELITDRQTRVILLLQTIWWISPFFLLQRNENNTYREATLLEMQQKC